MKNIRLTDLERYVQEIMEKMGLTAEESRIMADIYMETTKRGVGHHDIYNLPSRLEALERRTVNSAPEFKRLSSFGALEQWDGDNGLGELVCHHSMERAIALAEDHGIGLCAVRNSNHYLCSAPYVLQAARRGYIGFIIAKGVPTMGVPGAKGKVVGQSPIGYAFPAGGADPVMLDICLAYVSGEQLARMAADRLTVPGWWGVDRDGRETDSAEALAEGTKYGIGEHKGFGLAILCELLTGVLSGGLILDQDEEKPGIKARSTSHTAIAVKADGLMSREEYDRRSQELTQRIRARAEEVHIPGDASWQSKRELEEKGEIVLSDTLADRLIEYGGRYRVSFLYH